MNYLDFELPIKELEDQLNDCKVIGEKSDVDVSKTIEQIENKLKQTKKEIYSNLTPWQRVQMSRHPDRPYTLDYIDAIFGDSFFRASW
jgi:acetyl-CoA carboxylase carboxyl transferase subunit alpha